MIGSPLTGPAPSEVPLTTAPLETVVTQIRFSAVLALGRQEEVARFQELIRRDYPHFLAEMSEDLLVEIGPAGPKVIPKSTPIWRFLSGDKKWRVTLAQDFLSLESREYSSRRDFLHRIRWLVGNLEAVYAPSLVTRIGLRYLSRIKGEHFSNRSALFRSPFQGLFGSPMEPALLSSTSEVLLRSDEGQLMLRIGQLPPGAVIPELLSGIPEPSVVLDIDSFSDEEMSFQTDAVDGRLAGLAERAYAVFRATVTDDFLRAYGGQV